MPTVLIGAEPIRRQPGRFRSELEAAGFTILDPPLDGKLTRDDLLELLPPCHAVVAGGERYSAEILAACPHLRVIARTGVGYDDVDVTAATARNIVVTITPGTNHEAVAEHAFALLLALLKDVTTQDRETRLGLWNRKRLPRPVRGLTIGIVGLGRIGQAMADRARAFRMQVLAYDPLIPPETDGPDGVRPVTLEELLARSDVVSLHLPLTPETRGQFDRSAFSRMKPGALLINTARGGVIVERDLVEALTSGRLAGAGLDVLELEPPAKDNPLFALPNVVLTPHLAGIDTRSMDDMATMAARTIVTLARGEWPLEGVINPALAAGWRW
jgi:phosphoglycerate dehydrogenase-like enzyme